MTRRQRRTMVLRLLPGIALPGLIYFIAARHTSVVVALACASAVPLLDSAVRLARGRRVGIAGMIFPAFAAGSIGLALRLHSPIFILARGAVMSAVLGCAFAVSAAVGRPLTRWLAVSLSTEHADARRRLLECWRHPRAVAAFRVLSAGWGALLVALAVQQTVMVLSLSPGIVMAVDPPVQGVATVLGIATSVLYVRRVQQEHPDVALLPAAHS